MRPDPSPRIHPMTCDCARCRAPGHTLANAPLRIRLIACAGAIGVGILISLLAH